MMPRCLRIALFAALAAAATGCASTRVTTAWRAPGRAPVTFTKVLAVERLGESESQRRAVESEICARVQPPACTPSFQVFPGGITDVAAAKAQVRADGYDGAIVFRLLEERQQVTYTPPTYAPTSFWSLYGPSSTMVPNPAHVRTDTLVRVETSVYDLTADEMVWVGTTQTLNPRDLPGLVDGVATAVAADMREHGLLAPAP